MTKELQELKAKYQTLHDYPENYLTPLQLRTLWVFKSFMFWVGRTPNISEVGDIMGIHSHDAIARQIDALIDGGFLLKAKRPAGSIALVNKEINNKRIRKQFREQYANYVSSMKDYDGGESPYVRWAIT